MDWKELEGPIGRHFARISDRDLAATGGDEAKIVRLIARGHVVTEKQAAAALANFVATHEATAAAEAEKRRAAEAARPAPRPAPPPAPTAQKADAHAAPRRPRANPE